MIDCIDSTIAANSAPPTGTAAGAATLGADRRSEKHARMSATSASPLSTLVTVCDVPLVRCPRHRMAVNTTTVAVATHFPNGAIAGTSSPTDVPITIDTAAVLAHVDNQSLHPITKPVYGPNACRANTYCPPDRGSIAPSSARLSAPRSAYTPPAIHTPKNSAGVGSRPAISPGAASMPAPIVFPMITASPNT